MVHEENTFVNLKLEKDMVFKTSLGFHDLKEMFIDESLDSETTKRGPDAAQLLGLAVLSCLSASFLFCLSKRNLTLDDLDGNAEVSFRKNERGYIRIEKIDVNITPKSKNPGVLKRVNQCLKRVKSGKMFFEETCIITPSVIEGIDVDVKVNL
ncbi:MAG: OsmC family protein [Promethearchaeota archaeon]